MENQTPDEVVQNQDRGAGKPERSDREKRLGTIGWALFFIWIGFSFLLKFDPGISLLGIGIITLGVQVARGKAGFKLEWFWVIIGLLLTFGGIWDLFEPDISLVPLLLILAGFVLLASAGRSKR